MRVRFNIKLSYDKNKRNKKMLLMLWKIEAKKTLIPVNKFLNSNVLILNKRAG
jgi:hypothetical protein